jgi:tellurite resistance protein TerC
MWYIFWGLVIFLLIFDLGIISSKNRQMTLRESIYYSIFYIFIASIFGIYIFFSLGSSASSDYFTCFLLEKIMALDNIFIISLIFQFFKIENRQKHKILLYGILAVIILRGIMIYFGTMIVSSYSWILYIFAIFLIYTGVKSLIFDANHNQFSPETSSFYKIIHKYLNIYDKNNSNKFFIKENGKIFVTNMFLALMMVEIVDAAFALDSIPAVLAVSNDRFIIYSSNIFAIMGLRALFFCLSYITDKFKYVKYSLSIILIFIGMKIFIEHFIEIQNYISFIFIISALLIGIIISLYKSN